MNPQDFDPDEFVLQKQDVIDFINIVIKYWSRTTEDKIRNIKLIAGLEMMKAGVHFTSEADFKTIWSMLLQFIMALQYENTLQKDKDWWGSTLSKVKSDLRDNGLEKFFSRYQKKK